MLPHVCEGNTGHTNLINQGPAVSFYPDPAGDAEFYGQTSITSMSGLA